MRCPPRKGKKLSLIDCPERFLTQISLYIFLLLLPESAQALGDLIWTQSNHLGYYQGESYATAVDSTGVYTAGWDREVGDSYQWRIEKRNLTDGSLLWIQTSNPSTEDDRANAIAIDSTGVYI